MVLGEIGILPEYRGVTRTLPGVIGPSWALRERRRGCKRCAAPPPLPSLNRTRRGGRRPPFPSPLPPPSPFLLLQLGKKGVLLPVGVGLPLGAPSLASRPVPLGSFIYGGGGTP